jgi:endonuclease-3
VPARTSAPARATEAARISAIIAGLQAQYPEARTALAFGSTFQLLVAVILSAQCTDKRVNLVTADLFKRYRTPGDFAKLEPDDLEPQIKTCGLGPSKARNIVATSRLLLERHAGQVPGTMEELIKLPGVGRKTANVMLANAFDTAAIAVDTHVFRVAHRLGLSGGSSPEATERDLQRVIPEAQWAPAHHWLIWHGREICRARKPECGRCPVLDYCPTGRDLSGLPPLKGLKPWHRPGK